MIPYGRQSIDQRDIDAVVGVLRSDFLTQGPMVPRFEQSVLALCGAKYAIAVNSATSALHLACLALDVGPRDVVWTSPITFVASANCALYCGADVDFVDIDARTYNMSPAALEAKLVAAEKAGMLPKVVIPVHLSGQSCEMAAIHALAGKYGFRIIEDASHAIGGRYRGAPVGSSRYSDITIFSFHPVKVVTSAEGGMAVTNDEALAARMTRLRTHGITRQKNLMTREPDGPWYYEQLELGYNYRLTDLCAALGHSQMQRLPEFLAARHRIAVEYDRRLVALPVTIPYQHPDSYSGLHLYVVRVKPGTAGRSQKEMFERMHASGVAVNLHYIPVHLQPYYRALGFKPGHCPEAESYYAEAMSIPMYPDLTSEDIDQVVSALAAAVGHD